MGLVLHSLNHPSQFKAILSTRPVAVDGAFQIFCTHRAAHIADHASDQVSDGQAEHPWDLSGVWVGLILPKKSIRRAVQRNRVKRWFRQELRSHTGALAFLADLPADRCVHLVLRVRSPIILNTIPTRKEARLSLLRCLERLSRHGLGSGSGVSSHA